MRINPGERLLSRVLGGLGVDRTMPGRGSGSAGSVPLPSRLATGDLAWASVAAATLAGRGDVSAIDPHRVATAYRSDRVLTIDGVAPPVWAPLSGFWRTADGWIRTHGNYPHHAAAMRAALHLSATADSDEVRGALLAHSADEAVTAITAASGLAVHVRSEDPAADAALHRLPLLDIRRLEAPAPRRIRSHREAGGVLDGMRVLDLTRVIAGPVCSRTLALLGADVLRIDPPHLPEPDWQHLDTGHGKRSALLDASSSRLDELLAQADAVVLGYRPASLARLGLDPETLTRRHPGLLVAQLSAWGDGQPERAGFDSLVQAESGIALIESPDGVRPGVLPAQALDHSAGYLLAAALTVLRERRSQEGGSWIVRTSLRRIAAELLTMPRRSQPEPATDVDPAAHIARFDVAGHIVSTARPALPGLEFAAPRMWGADQPRW